MVSLTDVEVKSAPRNTCSSGKLTLAQITSISKILSANPHRKEKTEKVSMFVSVIGNRFLYACSLETKEMRRQDSKLTLKRERLAATLILARSSTFSSSASETKRREKETELRATKREQT